MNKLPGILTITAFAGLSVGTTHGAIYFTDVLDKAGDTGGAPVTVLDTTHPDFDGIDDTFTGTVTFTVTIHYDAFTGADAYTGFVLANGGTETVALGNPWPQDYWGGYNNGNVAGPSGFFQIPGAANIDPVNEATGTYTMVIDYVAGGNDTGTVSLSGISGVTGDFTLAAEDYSFDEILVRNGNSAATTTVDFTDMSVSIPEPSSMLLAGLGGLALLRRRRQG